MRPIRFLGAWLGGALLALWLIHGGPVSEPLAVNKTGVEQQNLNSTAVLFLVDESGGVNGACSRALPAQVWVTDAAGTRYQFLEFFLTLWQDYYSLEWASPVQRPQLAKSLSPFSLGVAQFAADYSPLLEFTSLQNFQDSEFPSPAWEQYLRDLDSGNRGATSHSEDWFCKTHFPEVLDAAARNLNAQGAAKKIIVLLTDGSFRGSDLEASSLADREWVRNATEMKLQGLQQQGIQVLVGLWDPFHCTPQDSTCPLDANEIQLRQGDLDRWVAWDGKKYIRLLDANNFWEGFGSDPDIVPLLPGARFPYGWMRPQDSRVILHFPGSAEMVRIRAIHSPGNGSGDPIRIYDENNLGKTGYFVFPHILAVDERVTLLNRTQGCPQYEWTLINSGHVELYYWLTYGDQEKTRPELAPLKVQPADPILLAPDTSIVIQTELVSDTLPLNPQCYEVSVELAYGETRRGQTIPFSASKTVQSATFDLLPTDLPWGTLITVTARLNYVGGAMYDPSFLVVTRSVAYPLEVGEVSFYHDKASDQISLTVPIRGATRLPDPENAVRFGLFPRTFRTGEEYPVGGTNCACGGKQFDAAQSKVLQREQDTIYYRVIFPAPNFWSDINGCCYNDLLVQFLIGNEGQDVWRSVTAPCPANCVEPTSAPPLPTNVGTPVAVSTPTDSWPPACGSTVLFVLGVLVLFLRKAR